MSEDKEVSPRIIVHSPSSSNFPFVDDEEDVSGRLLSQDEDYFGHADEHLEHPGPLPSDLEFGSKAAALRRNSISLPSGLDSLDLELLRQEHSAHPANNIPEHGNGSDSNSYSGDHDSDETNNVDEENQRSKVPVRSFRKKSVMPGRAPDPNMLQVPTKGSDSSTIDSDDDSPVNSITSINSLASLLKEKIQAIPSKIKKKPTDYKIRAFVGFLFLCIIFFVGFAYIMYHQQVLARAYFDKIKFNKEKRIIKIFNKEGTEILLGNLGVTLGSAKAYSCLEHENKDDGSLCLEWLSGHRLYLNRHHVADEENVKCYQIRWQALTKGAYPTDCYDWSLFDEHWYGGGQSVNMSWPIENMSQDFSPFITGDINNHQWGNAIMRYFLSSRGAAIIIDDETPLYVAINNKKICMKAMNDNFAFVNHFTKYPELSYKLCTSNDMQTLHSSLSQKSLWDGLKQKDIDILESLLSEPVWHISPRNKESLTGDLIQNYTEDVIALGFLKQGHVLINEFWQNQMGDFELDDSRFQSLGDTVNIIHRRGFKIAFTIQPFISTESPNFAECVHNKILITERLSDRRIPALTKYKFATSAGVLDITNNKTSVWLKEKLNKVVNKYHIDTFFLDLGTAYDMPHYYQCEKMLRNPDQYKTLFTDSFHNSISILGVSSAISLPKPPVFVSLPPFASTWEAIKNVIPTILSYGTIGYPLVMPGAVGGDIDWPGGDQFVPGSFKSYYEDENEQAILPEKELYLRWLQLATFLPVMKFTHLPSKYNDEQILEVAKILTNTRLKVVLPILLKYYKESLDRGIPFIRPLWMLESDDQDCQTIDDEFSIGEEIIVAPVLEKGATYREVYLPAGVWKDGIDGSLRKGSRWIHDYRVPLDKIAYFVKMPDNTRF